MTHLSSCCKAPVTTSTADEGTSCYICTKCNRPCDTTPTNPSTVEEKLERIAMNIVYQLDDDSGLSVEFRQANNDKRIDFVKSLLSTLTDSTLREVEEIVKNSRTVDETYGVGQKEHTARMQVLADLAVKRLEK
jgi:hypothetical protein